MDRKLIHYIKDKWFNDVDNKINKCQGNELLL